MARSFSFWLSSRSCAVILCCVVALFLSARSASAAITVTSNGDGPATPANCPGANCTLRDAIAAAAAGETINFAVIGEITLAGAELFIDKDLTIQGPGANLLAVSGANLSRVFFIDQVPPGLTVNISGLTIKRGNGGEGGGLYFREGTLNLTACHFTENTAGEGGGVYLKEVGGTFTACTFSNNRTTGEGGGIWFGWFGRTLTLVNCTVSGNQTDANGAGIRHDGFCGNSTLQVFNSTIANNTSTMAGVGGIYTTAAAGECDGITAKTILRSTIIANNSLPNLAAVASPGSTVMVTSLGYNLASDNPAAFLNQPTDILNTNPQLAPLAFYGGPTPTMALLNNSPALDKGNSFGLVFDQRGLARTFNFPAIANAADGTDIGAFELDAQSLVQVADPSVCLDPGDRKSVV